MYETGASEAEARKHIEKLIQKAWRNMNKCQIDNETPFARSFVGTAINLARIAQCTYQHGDGHGAPDSRSKNRMLISCFPALWLSLPEKLTTARML
jgi:isoprene synthase